MNYITKKLIVDVKENKKVKRNMVSLLIGTALLLIGILCFVARPPVTMDNNGFLQESLLTPLSFLFFIVGLMIFIVTGVTNLIGLFYEKVQK